VTPPPPESFDWKRIMERAGPYPLEAFEFVQLGLRHTAERVLAQANLHMHAGGLQQPDSHHVTGQQLCLGLRDFAIEQYGMLAPAVLRHWRVHRTEDFGRMVYAMIEAGALSKTAEDSIDDFAGVYDFAEAFSAPQLAQRLGAR